MKRTTDRFPIRHSHARLPRTQPMPRRVSPLFRCSFCGTETCICRQRISATATGAALVKNLRTARDMQEEEGANRPMLRCYVCDTAVREARGGETGDEAILCLTCEIQEEGGTDR